MSNRAHHFIRLRDYEHCQGESSVPLALEVFPRDASARHQTKRQKPVPPHKERQISYSKALLLSPSSPVECAVPSPQSTGGTCTASPPPQRQRSTAPAAAPQVAQVHSLQGEGEVVLAGLAVAHQVAGLLAEPQQRLCVRPADGPMIPAAGGRGTWLHACFKQYRASQQH